MYVTRATQTIPYFYNRAPTAVADSFSTPIETTLTMNLVANDTDPGWPSLNAGDCNAANLWHGCREQPHCGGVYPKRQAGVRIQTALPIVFKDTLGGVLVCGFSQHQLQQLQLSANHQAAHRRLVCLKTAPMFSKRKAKTPTQCQPDLRHSESPPLGAV